MNHLAHFHVSWPDPGLIIGGFLGDFVKGRLNGEFPAPIERGIALHRAVDAFTDRHAVTRRSVMRFAPQFRRVGPIMVDVIYDHLLARHWESEAEQTLAGFSDQVFDAISECEAELPTAATATAARMQAARSLEAYQDEAFIQRSFGYLSKRLKRDNPLGQGFAEFKSNERELVNDYRIFLPDLMEFSRQWQINH